MNESEAEELRFALNRVKSQLEDCAIRGTRASGAEERARLSSLAAELNGLGAVRLAARMASLESALGSANAPAKLMEAQTALRLVERVATLEASAELLEAAAWREEHDAEEYFEDEDEEDASDSPASEDDEL